MKIIKPAYIITVVEMSGGAGSTDFLRWMQEEEEYRTVYVYKSALVTAFDRFVNTLIVLVRKDIEFGHIAVIQATNPNSLSDERREYARNTIIASIMRRTR